MKSTPLFPKTRNDMKDTVIPQTQIFINNIILDILPELEKEDKVLMEIYYLLEDLIGQTDPWTFTFLELKITVLASLDTAIKEDRLGPLVLVLEGLLLTMAKNDLMTFEALAQFLSNEKKRLKEKVFFKNNLTL